MAEKNDGHFNEKWDDATIYQISADKAQGMTIKQLAAKYNMTQQQVKYVVYRRLKNENIERGLAITNVALKEAGVAAAKPKTESVTITVTGVGMAAPDPVPSAQKTTVTTAVDQGVFDKKEEPVHRGLWATLWHKLFG